MRTKWCAYPRYQFSNASDDLRKIFTDTCDRLGTGCRQRNARNVSVARRASVARRDEVVGVRGDQLVVRVQAPPVDGKANAAVEAFVAHAVGVPKSAVSVVRGHTSRDKVVRIEGAGEAGVRQALWPAPAG